MYYNRYGSSKLYVSLSQFCGHSKIVSFDEELIILIDEEGMGEQLDITARVEINPEDCLWATNSALETLYRDQWLKQLPVYLGMHDEVKAFVESLPNPHSNIRDPLEVIFGLGSAELLETHVRRLKILLTKPVHVRAWLAHTEYKALDWVRESILKAENKEQAVELFEILALVKASENALQMLTLMRSSKVPELARRVT